MKLTKIKLILIAFSLLISFNLQSQIYLAGNHLGEYVDIIPDTLMNYTCPTGIGSTEDYYFDVNGDSQNDFKLNATCDPWVSDKYRYIYIASLNPDSYIRFGRYDSVYHSYNDYWWVTKVALPLQYEDTINSVYSKWDSTYLYLTDNSFTTGTFKTVTDWISTNDEYIGIKYQNTTDTIYGWIRVHCPSLDSCYIKDYSIVSLIQNTLDFESGNFNIYPNPATDKIYIVRTNNNTMAVSLFDMIGKQVREEIKSKTQSTKIDVSNLQKGVYILKITINNNSLNKKIIIE